MDFSCKQRNFSEKLMSFIWTEMPNAYHYIQSTHRAKILFLIMSKRPNRLRFVLPISSHVTMLLGAFRIILLFAFMAEFAWYEICKRNQKMFYQEIDHMA